MSAWILNIEGAPGCSYATNNIYAIRASSQNAQRELCDRKYDRKMPKVCGGYYLYENTEQ